MNLHNLHRSICVSVVAVAVVAHRLLDVGSAQNWILLTVLSLALPLIVLRFWNQEPAQSVAELLHVTELRR